MASLNRLAFFIHFAGSLQNKKRRLSGRRFSFLVERCLILEVVLLGM
jgi:hypothetical protein